jgi:hypothetical protein
VSCRKGPRLRRRWAEFPLVRAGDGRADLRDTRLFAGRPGPHGKEDTPLFEPSLTGLSNNDETIERSER